MGWGGCEGCPDGYATEIVLVDLEDGQTQQMYLCEDCAGGDVQ